MRCDTQSSREFNYQLFSLTFHWVFIQWLQSELDSYYRVNNTAKCKDRNKILLNAGVPAHMFQFPEDYGAEELELLQGMEELRGGESAAGQYYMGASIMGMVLVCGSQLSFSSYLNVDSDHLQHLNNLVDQVDGSARIDAEEEEALVLWMKSALRTS
ncbi:hypothetical protein FB45DRAFT_1093424 [Roridomyces roridus]|uniref:Uncharacterized protein n=1 Tax=Roridomyces roridus TaxID=1738132 RepID=A0AAD7FAG1_9AGAR|nr:hypothetical protein FB45DRAFT_1135768 [Roridomyces roridus]KAJ7621492.1 hypothetical protein FB45DRAFT_1093424 [Roridomyces roridus]